MQPDLLANPAPTAARYDELLAAPGSPRAHWARFHAELQGTTGTALADRIGLVERAIRDSGVTYNVYADPQGLDRPWDLDVLPLILPTDEWAQIAAGIAQRANLLNRVLADLYGEARLLHEGRIPPALILGHSGFLRPACGTRPPGGIFLHSYAADLARSPDGRWWVLADRTQAPSGAGYALENRLLVARLFPELFRELQVARIAQHFNSLRESLLHYAPTVSGPALAVVLTPGPYNETYFEHGFLARYLGFPLVEGGDLVVRDGCLWLKTIEGLQRVHTVLRRQDDSFCDPLELRADSALGVPGLMECARRGTVLVANALGSGVLESGALLGYLPTLCEHLLGEPLRLPSIATWWCGEPSAQAIALSHIEHLVFKPADPARRFEPVFGAELSPGERAAFAEQVRAEPGRYVAQELVRVSQAPTLTPRRPDLLGTRPIGLRVFAVVTPDGYQVMPGGLTRVAADADPYVVSMQRGGSAKDTWVLSGTPAAAAAPVPASPRIATTHPQARRQVIIASRVVENLFWYGRYAERCDQLARLLRIGLNAAIDSEITEAAVARVAAALGLPIDRERPAEAWSDAATQDQQAYGLPNQLRQLNQVAFSLRERMSLDNWQAINRLVQDPVLGRRVSLTETLLWIDRAVSALMSLSGFALDGMTRDSGWRFLSIGRRLERLSSSALCLSLALEKPGEGLGWLLELADSSVTYRARYTSQPEWGSVLELLLYDEENPRSLMFQLRGIRDYLRKLSHLPNVDYAAQWGALVDNTVVLGVHGDVPPDLSRQLLRLREHACQFSDTLTQHVFNHLGRSAQALLAR